MGTNTIEQETRRLEQKAYSDLKAVVGDCCQWENKLVSARMRETFCKKKDSYCHFCKDHPQCETLADRKEAERELERSNKKLVEMFGGGGYYKTMYDALQLLGKKKEYVQ